MEFVVDLLSGVDLTLNITERQNGTGFMKPYVIKTAQTFFTGQNYNLYYKHVEKYSIVLSIFSLH